MQTAFFTGLSAAGGKVNQQSLFYVDVFFSHFSTFSYAHRFTEFKVIETRLIKADGCQSLSGKCLFIGQVQALSVFAICS